MTRAQANAYAATYAGGQVALAMLVVGRVRAAWRRTQR